MFRFIIQISVLDLLIKQSLTIISKNDLPIISPEDITIAEIFEIINKSYELYNKIKKLESFNYEELNSLSEKTKI